MTERELLEHIRGRIDRAKLTQAEAARAWRVAPQYLCDVLAGRRPPGPKLLRAVGIHRRISYDRS